MTIEKWREVDSYFEGLCLSATTLQAVGAKGYDGFLLTLVTSDP